VKTNVTTQTAAPAAYSGEAAVGKTIDGDVVWREAPNYPKYHWARLNGQRVVVETDSHKVVAVY
jgi:hypothetical protein